MDPVGEEEGGEGRDAVDGAAVGELEVLAGVVEGGVETEGALIVEDGLGEAVEAEVGIAEVVEQLGTCLTCRQGVSVVFDGSGVVLLAEGGVTLLRLRQGVLSSNGGSESKK